MAQIAPNTPGTALVEDLVGLRLRCLGLEEEALDRLLGGRRRLLEAIHRPDAGERGGEGVVVE